MSDLTGQTVGRYHLVEKLGFGGMAVVYKAFDTRLERIVAIKFIRRETISEEMASPLLKRFEREAISLAKLSHANIVKIFDYGDYNGSPYLVMEYMQGGTLKQKAGAPMPARDAARILSPIARALAYAHSQGVIHRDIKPANILLNSSGEPMLSDFGIAKILGGEETTSLTGTNMGIGTPEYMAPEQCNGKTLPQTDIYALGVVLYELLTGRKPYTADTPMAVLIKQISEPLPRPRLFTPDLPESAEFIIFKALAKNPEDRFNNMTEMANALDLLAAPPTFAQNPPPMIETATRTAPRIPTPSPAAPPLVYPTRPAYVVPPTQAAVQPVKQKASFPIWVIFLLAALVLVVGALIGVVVLGEGIKGRGILAMLATRTPTDEPTPTQTPSPSATDTPVPTPTWTASSIPTETSSPTFTRTPTFTLSPTRTQTPTLAYTLTMAYTSTSTRVPFTRTFTLPPATSTPDKVTITIINKHCYDLDVRVNNKVITTVKAEGRTSFRIKPGDYRLKFCNVGTTTCGSEATEHWVTNSSVTISRASYCK